MFSGICQLARILYSQIGEPLHVQVITAGPNENPKGAHSKTNFCIYQQCHLSLGSMLEFSGLLREFQLH
jgi:hypothetical protein